MFKKILIANRGEIAARIIRACKELGISTVSVHSEADKEALHAISSDETCLIGPPRVARSYLNADNIISAAVASGAEAIHPGYGLLSENPGFADACEKAGIVFIGPPVAAIRKMGIKTEAREIMMKAGIPVVPGSSPTATFAEAMQAARHIGFPIMVKASAGGGGIGMQLVEKEEDLEKAFDLCRQRAQAAFGIPDVYLEKYIQNPRHIEIQVFADRNGHTVHLGERECSIQRRHQKIIEESPSPFIDESMRSAMGACAVMACKAIHYVGAGTVEFLVDANRNFYFLEMNTRLQVEHPVTEMVASVDLVKEQIYVASGQNLSWNQEEILLSGHALECRIYAENPYNFRPSTGLITRLSFPRGENIRVDHGIREGYAVTPYYDSMLAKIIVRAEKRNDAIALMKEALNETVIEGVKTNIPLLIDILNDSDFCTGEIDTFFINSLLQRLQDNGGSKTAD
ncbi:MAG: acetyl-CoA carboxylase biotin carboxylase subunit [Deltaproteobacteria bacterium HGW-Deltaproteobacteria-12]|jgi:acetyl-CoA carboxylase biotin carboxylase subunit|nr:MAG: acetyl-CoA carboxylase biotin carboxylase subunit [Deltaproteobacteria bacterium HGW-Deltaproteobacteria-12]